MEIRKKYRINLYEEKVEVKENGPTSTVEIDEEFDYTGIPDDYEDSRMNIIGQNGNDGEHYKDIEPKHPTPERPPENQTKDIDDTVKTY